MKKETDIYSEARRRIHEPSKPVRYTPKKCIAKTKQDCFYFSCIFNHHNGGNCTKEEQLPADGIELRHKVKLERIDRTTFRDWPQIMHKFSLPSLRQFNEYVSRLQNKGLFL